MKFELNKDVLSDINWDSDLFYDLTKGGYIDPDALLDDKALAAKISEAADLVAAFLDAVAEQGEALMFEEGKEND